MRPILHGDVSCAARALFAVPSGLRRDLCQRMLTEADRAEAHVRHTGKAHPMWGNGSLMSAARKRPLADEPGFDDAAYCQCFEMVLRAIVAHKITRLRN